jgi:hypothetical protein
MPRKKPTYLDEEGHIRDEILEILYVTGTQTGRGEKRTGHIRLKTTIARRSHLGAANIALKK